MAVALKTAIESAGTTSDRGTTVAEGRPSENLAVTGTEPQLANEKFTVVPGSAVVCANRHVVDGSGEPRRRDTPPVAPDDHCWSSLPTTAPDSAVTMVPMLGSFCTKSPTFSTTSWPAGTTRPGKSCGAITPAPVRNETFTTAWDAVGLKSESVRVFPGDVEPPANDQRADTCDA